MNPRIDQIVLRLLAVLHVMPNGQCSQGVLKASVDLQVHPNTLESEFAEALAFAQTEKWIIGVRPALGPVKWSITDAGRAQHLQTL
jgi:hypothetical protein